MDSRSLTLDGKKVKEKITTERLRELLHYGQDTGKFSWRVDRRGHAKAGCIAGALRPDGYLRITLDGECYMAHRLAWLYTNGVWPSLNIDHINRVRSNNRISNLRDATHAENSQNTPMNSRNSSGYRGVSWHNKVGRWRANIGIKGNAKHLGYFDTPEAAYEAYKIAASEFHTCNPVAIERLQ